MDHDVTKEGLVICHEDNTHVFQNISFPRVMGYIGYIRLNDTCISIQSLLVYWMGGHFWVSFFVSHPADWQTGLTLHVENGDPHFQ